MPELPEVEVICNGLKNHVTHEFTTNVKLTRPSLRIPFPINFAQDLVNNQIVTINRRAKYIQIFLSNKRVLVVHLGMTGRFIIKDNNYILNKHDHVVISLGNGNKLIFNDTRRFGLMTIIDQDQINQHELFKNLGPEPLEKEFDANYLATKLQNKSSPIKNLIMDNKIVVGVGNIYASESLYHARICPTTIGKNLSFNHTELLVANIKEVLSSAILAGGSTIRDYVDVENNSGYFQQAWQVYARAELNCNKCNDLIIKIKQAGRSSFYCPTCQAQG